LPEIEIANKQVLITAKNEPVKQKEKKE